MSQNFPPELRLRSKADFSALRGARRLRVDGLCFVCRKSDLTHARLGLAVSTKYGNAVHRNRLKRILRDTFRCHQVRNYSIDILIFPDKSARHGMNFQQMMGRGLDRIIHTILNKT